MNRGGPNVGRPLLLNGVVTAIGGVVVTIALDATTPTSENPYARED